MAKAKQTDLTKQSRQAPGWMFWVLPLLAFLLYMPTLWNGYNYDDELVTKNHPLTSEGIKAIPDIFTSSYYADSLGYAYGYRPVTLTSFAIEHTIAGENPGVSHAVNLFLFIGTVWISFNLLLRLLKDWNYWIPFFATVLFIVHPIHTEAVCSIKNRDELLCFLLGISSFLIFLKGYDRQKWLNYGLACVLILLAMWSKKSIYPIVLWAPVAIALFRPVKLYALFYPTALWILSAAFAASNFEFNTFLLISIVPLLVLFPYFLILEQFNAFGKKAYKQPFEKRWKKLFKALRNGTHEISPLLIGILGTVLLSLFFWGIYRGNNDIMLGAIACSVLLLLFNRGPFWFIASIVAGIWATYGALFGLVELYMFASFLSGYTLFQLFPVKRLRLISGLPAAITMGIYFIPYFDWSLILVPFSAWLLFYLWHRRWNIGMLVSFLVILTSFIISGSIDSFSVAILFTGMLMLTRNFRGGWVNISFFFGILVLLYTLTSQSVAIPHPAYQKFVAGDIQLPSFQTAADLQKPFTENPFREGRTLDYAENTLIHERNTGIRISTGLVIMQEYIRLMVFPVQLSFYYGYAEVETAYWNDIRVWFALILHLLIFIVFIFTYNRSSPLAWGILIYTASIFIFSNIPELVAGMVGERLAYVASWGYCIALASVPSLFVSPATFRASITWDALPKQLRYGFVLLALVLGFLTVRRVLDWKTDLTLMEADIAHLDFSAQAHNMLAQRYFSKATAKNVLDAGALQKSINHFQKAVTIYPNFYNAQILLARAQIIAGDLNQAAKAYENALSIDDTSLTEPYTQLAAIYAQQGLMGRSNSYLYRLLAKKPNDFGTLIGLSGNYFQMGQTDSCLQVSLRTIKHWPDAYEPYVNIGKIVYNKGLKDSSRYWFEIGAQKNAGDAGLNQFMRDQGWR